MSLQFTGISLASLYTLISVLSGSVCLWTTRDRNAIAAIVPAPKQLPTIHDSQQPTLAPATRTVRPFAPSLLEISPPQPITTPPPQTPPPPPSFSPPLQTFQSPPPPPFQPDSALAEAPYRLGSQDVIFVNVQRFPNLNYQGLINPEGNIVMQLIGTVPLEGLSLVQAQQRISAALNRYLVNPVVSVSLLQQRPVQVTVTGEVARPGYYPLQSPRISEALFLAGGTTREADLRLIRIRRPLPDGSFIEQVIDLYTPILRGGTFPNLRLEDGDVILVPNLALSDPSDYDRTLIGRSTLAQRQASVVTITGEVTRPGYYTLPENPRLADALLLAGGVTSAANLQTIQLRRTFANGSIQEQIVDLYTPLANGQELPPIPLENGDVVIVSKLELAQSGNYDSNLAARANLTAGLPVNVTVLGEVARPGFHTVPPSLRPVSDALLVAGGISSTADLRGVRVRRVRTDGTMSEEIVDLFTPLQTGGDLPNLPLANGDTIIVPQLEISSDENYNRSLVSRSTLAQQQISVRILSYASGGIAVQPLPSGSTFTDILSIVPLQTANLREIALIRFDPELGRAVTLELDAKAALMGDPSQDVLLEDNDIIVIEQNLIARITYALSTFTQPFRDVLGFLLFFDSLAESADNLFGPANTRDEN